jgi:hypothetical protein
LISWTHSDPLGALWEGLGRQGLKPAGGFSHWERAWRSIEATRRMDKESCPSGDGYPPGGGSGACPTSLPHRVRDSGTGQKSAAVPPTRHRIPRPSSSSRNGGRNLSRNGARGPKSRAPVRALAGAPHVAQLGLSQRDTHAIYRHPNPRCQIKSWLLGRRDHLQAGTHETLVPRPH